MLRLLRHLAYEGPRHAGRVTTRRLPHHYELHTPMRAGMGGPQHVVTTRAGLEALAAMAGPADTAHSYGPGTPELLGIPVYVDTCPCPDLPLPQLVQESTLEVGDLAAVADMRAMLRARAAQRRPQFPLITGGWT